MYIKSLYFCKKKKNTLKAAVKILNTALIFSNSYSFLQPDWRGTDG